MAQDGVLGKSPAAFLEDVHVVYSLADERPFTEQVLVNVRHDARVRIDARLAREQANEPGPPGTRQAYADARLQDAVARDDPAPHRVEYGLVECVSHRPDH